MHCPQGGVAFEKQQLCNNYTSKPTIYIDKYIMSIESGTRNLILVIYSFKGYSQVSVDATLTSTPCRGLFNEDKCTFYSLITSFQALSASNGCRCPG